MRKVITIGVVAGVLFLAPVYVAFADIIANPEWPMTPQTFSFYCEPYQRPFVESFHYLPNDPATCYFTVPQILAYKLLSIYKGTVGNAEYLNGGIVQHTTRSKFRITPAFTFNKPAVGDDLFAAIYSANTVDELVAGDLYLRTGAGTPPEDLTLVGWKWGPKPVSEFDPVVIIPGILGSWEKNGKWVLDPITHIYDNLVDTFLANGYVEGKTLFKFPYDWHNSNVVTAQLLEQKIEDVKDICDCSYVDIVAHSMGGLVATQYMKEVATSSVDQAFYLGVPFTGSPRAYKTWEGGEVDFGNDLQNMVMSRVFQREAHDQGYVSIFDYIRGKPVTSVQELLPTYPNYLGTGTTSFRYPTGYPRNTFLEALSSNEGYSKIYWAARHSAIIGNTGISSTTKYFYVKPSTQLPKWEHGEPTRTFFGSGDNTVPFDSATYFFWFDKQFDGYDHTQIVSKSSSYLFKALNNRDPDSVIEKNYDTVRDADYAVLLRKIAPSKGDFKAVVDTVQTFLKDSIIRGAAIRSVLFVTLFSPIEVEVTAPDGSTFTTNSEHGYLLIPDPLAGEYKVRAVGTGNGTYTIATSYINSASTTEALVDGSITTGMVSEYELTLGDSVDPLVFEPSRPRYTFSGFFQPINPEGQPLSVFKAGSTVPVKFQLRNEAGNIVQAETVPVWQQPQQGSKMNALVSEPVVSAPATSGDTFRWDSTSQQYIYNWNTKNFSAGYWYKIAVLVDGVTYSVTVGLR